MTLTFVKGNANMRSALIGIGLALLCLCISLRAETRAPKMALTGKLTRVMASRHFIIKRSQYQVKQPSPFKAKR
jgi:hypothetical protein